MLLRYVYMELTHATGFVQKREKREQRDVNFDEDGDERIEKEEEVGGLLDGSSRLPVFPPLIYDLRPKFSTLGLTRSLFPNPMIHAGCLPVTCHSSSLVLLPISACTQQQLPTNTPLNTTTTTAFICFQTPATNQLLHPYDCRNLNLERVIPRYFSLLNSELSNLDLNITRAMHSHQTCTKHPDVN